MYLECDNIRKITHTNIQNFLFKNLQLHMKLQKARLTQNKREREKEKERDAQNQVIYLLTTQRICEYLIKYKNIFKNKLFLTKKKTKNIQYIF